MSASLAKMNLRFGAKGDEFLNNPWTKWISFIALILAVVVAFVALGMAVTNKDDIDDIEKEVGMAPSSREGFCGAVTDGSDYSRATTAGHAQYQQPGCGAAAIPEPHGGMISAASGQPTYKHTSQAYHADYPDNTDPHSLAPKEKYGCAPDYNNTGNCDYSLNPDNLMPASWRDDTNCPDGSDPNSLWAKYAPTKDAYWRYVTAAGSARLSVNTRIPWRIVGTPLLLRSGVSVPLTHSQVTPFNGSSWRDDIVSDSLGYYPQDLSC